MDFTTHENRYRTITDINHTQMGSVKTTGNRLDPFGLLTIG